MLGETLLLRCALFRASRSRRRMILGVVVALFVFFLEGVDGGVEGGDELATWLVRVGRELPSRLKSSASYSSASPVDFC